MTRRPQLGAYVYPWDVDGDPAAADRLAALGVRRACVAAAYHAVRALTPRHPHHKVVTADRSAVYFPLDPARWSSADRLRPVEAAWSWHSFGPAVTALNDAGVEVYAWTILAHNDGLGLREPEATVVNAYGDRYPWALCIAQEQVQRHCATLAAEAASQPGLAGVELESCGWYGFDHLHAHDKSAGVLLPPSAKLLFSLCFCPACQDAYREAGADPARLRADVRAALDPVFAGTADDAHLPDEQSGAVARMRTAIATRLRERAVSAVRAERPDLPVLLHAHPDPLACGASPGLPPETAHALADAPVLLCPTRSDAALDAVRAYAGNGRRVVATVAAVQGLGADPSDLTAWCADLTDAGATELRFYHPGLASATDLEAMRKATAALR
ncbi:hypothetical protein [Streptacidiphilus anmyonensis]|uniref:hypothetical protein n=1 Tax=Streptacidiphilus anmyonensis TaxID=405782 RepID=UPI0005A7574A|nr:hypothetical protein [Streptacidiphilus anmyonensis]